MKLSVVSFAVLVAAAGLLTIAGCGQAAPSPTAAPVAPTKAAEPAKPAAAAAAPTKAAEPTKPAAAATAAPTVAKVQFPEKGKPITLIVPYDAGGVTDIAARLLIPPLEQALGTQVAVVNKPGAGTQVGLTELVKSKPDGYTMAYGHLSSTLSSYLDPRRQSTYDRKSFQPLAAHFSYAVAPVVTPSSPYKTLKDLIDTAKAKPESIKGATQGIGSIGHLAILSAQKATGAKFAPVAFTGDAPSITALLGGHVDVVFCSDTTSVPYAKRGELRPLGVMDKVRSPFYPDIPTFEQQGYQAYMGTIAGIYLPAGTPREIVDILAKAMKSAMENAEHKSKMLEMGFAVRFLGPEEYTDRWTESERQFQPLIEEIVKGG